MWNVHVLRLSRTQGGIQLMTSGRARMEGTESLWSIGPRKSAPDSYLKYRGTNKKRRYCERLTSELQQRHTRLFCRHKGNGISRQIILLLKGTDLDQVFVYMVVKAVHCAWRYGDSIFKKLLLTTPRALSEGTKGFSDRVGVPPKDLFKCAKEKLDLSRTKRNDWQFGS